MPSVFVPERFMAQSQLSADEHHTSSGKEPFCMPAVFCRANLLSHTSKLYRQVDSIHIKEKFVFPLTAGIPGWWFLSGVLICTQVDLSYKSLNKGDVFILETNKKIFVWLGSASSDKQRIKVGPT